MVVFQWDQMITTLPGLYLMSTGLAGPLALVLDIPIDTVCSVNWLRAVNVLFSLGNFYLIYAIQKKLHNPFLVSNFFFKII